MQTDPIVIVSAKRTPIGNFLGALAAWTAPQLASFCIKTILHETKIDHTLINEVYLGCVLPAGIGQAPARQAALDAGLSIHTPCTTINKVCGSGMKAVMCAFDLLHVIPDHVILAGGMESMSNAPHLLMESRKGKRFGHSELLDHILLDGLEDAYEKRKPMGYFAEQCAQEFHFSRAEQDAFSLTSLTRARNRIEQNSSPNEITPVHDTKHDERPFSVDPLRMSSLKPSFSENGTVTAGNSSSLSDGAAALLIMRESKAQSLGITPLAKIIAHHTYAQEPSKFTTAPISAIRTLLTKIHWKKEEVDLFEINEAFSVVVLACLKELNLSNDCVNIHGGACALGHPIGASGARIITTLLHNLIQTNKKRGIAALCIGGGEATAIAIERF